MCADTAEHVAAAVGRVQRLEHICELHLVLQVHSRNSNIGFARVLDALLAKPDSFISTKPVKFLAYDVLQPRITLSWSTCDELRSLHCLSTNIMIRNITHHVASWVPCTYLEAVTMMDVHADHSITRILPFSHSSFRPVRRLVLHRVRILFDYNWWFTWAYAWDNMRAHWKILAEIDVEDCGYVGQLTSGGTVFLPFESMPESVLKSDKIALRQLQVHVLGHRSNHLTP
jgi:hypothetical protein